MLETTFHTQTPSANIEIKVKSTIVLSKDLLDYENKEQFSTLCEKGCPTYNQKWACPPYSPSYSEYSQSYTYALVMCFYCNLNQFSYIKNDYLKIKAANAILKTKIDKFLRSLEEHFGGRLLSNGSCRLCKPCSCKEKKYQCQKPNQMRYSMEAVGLDAGKISKTFLNHELLWYRKNQLPSYTSVVSCLLSNTQNINMEEIRKWLLASTEIRQNNTQ